MTGAGTLPVEDQAPTCARCGGPLDDDITHTRHRPDCPRVEWGIGWDCDCPEVCADCCQDTTCPLAQIPGQLTIDEAT